MKNKLFILLPILLLSIPCCYLYKDYQKITIQNNSDVEIFYVWYKRPPVDSLCYITETTCETEIDQMYNLNVVRPHSKLDYVGFGDDLKDHVIDTIYILFFYWDDVIGLSCEEFEELWPIKEMRPITLQDMEDTNWTLTYE